MTGNLVIRDGLVTGLEDVEVVKAGQVVGVKVSHIVDVVGCSRGCCGGASQTG